MKRYEDYSPRALKRAPYLIENLTWLDKIQDKPCEDCGQKFPIVCMDFHHTNPSEKSLVLTEGAENGIRGMARSGYGIKTIKAEVNKCVVICSNCHRIRHDVEDNDYIQEEETVTLETFF